MLDEIAVTEGNAHYIATFRTVILLKKEKAVLKTVDCPGVPSASELTGVKYKRARG
jgi:hypothetical protein